MDQAACLRAWPAARNPGTPGHLCPLCLSACLPSNALLPSRCHCQEMSRNGRCGPPDPPVVEAPCSDSSRPCRTGRLSSVLVQRYFLLMYGGTYGTEKADPIRESFVSCFCTRTSRPPCKSSTLPRNTSVLYQRKPCALPGNGGSVLDPSARKATEPGL